ncbi:MAG: biotin/lipoyl-binding protein [Planctomycetota bacterium]|nr:MAG: biotin/lipoyl-binding protein [Planctomycetota bacterium]
MAQLAIHKILIANRGEIARRIMRTCRAMGISTVAVCSDADRDQPFVAEADEVVLLGGTRPSESYLRGEAIIEAAKLTGADAVHPGYGFLSENAEFARACREAGIVFIGPPNDAIAAMGSKIEAKRRMQKAEVPLLPTVEVAEQSADEVLRQVEKLGWPVLVKASAGGGGRGMRIVREPGQFAAQLETARQESQAAFGDGTLFVEPYVESGRHVEVQVFGDTHGNVVHLFERECSIQRRHQKVIEESPSPALNEPLRTAMTAAAVRAAREIGYVNAGTVEFLLTPEGKFYFLEVNTRLQVEHPVTECVTGFDLVRLQIQVAMGLPLPEEIHHAKLHGHAIEARLYAEDPAQDYRPAAGPLHRFRIPASEGVRVDSALDETAVVSPYYDAMLAKVIVHAPSRQEAARRLGRVLRQAQIHGLRTNRELLVRTLEHPEFLAGQTDTHFLERFDPRVLSAPLGDSAVERVHAAAATLAAQACRRREAPVLGLAPSGWRNNPSQFHQARYRGTESEILVEYRFQRSGLALRIDGEDQGQVGFGVLSPEQIRLEIGGVARTYNVHQVGDAFYVDSPLGSSELAEIPRFTVPEDEAAAGSLVAPLPGVVHELRVEQGTAVAAGDVLLVLDSMKMLHEIAAPAAGRVTELRVESGSHVDAGTVLAVIEETS